MVIFKKNVITITISHISQKEKYYYYHLFFLSFFVEFISLFREGEVLKKCVVITGSSYIMILR
jgi:hypothetical protein